MVIPWAARARMSLLGNSSATDAMEVVTLVIAGLVIYEIWLSGP